MVITYSLRCAICGQWTMLCRRVALRRWRRRRTRYWKPSSSNWWSRCLWLGEQSWLRSHQAARPKPQRRRQEGTTTSFVWWASRLASVDLDRSPHNVKVAAPQGTTRSNVRLEERVTTGSYRHEAERFVRPVLGGGGGGSTFSQRLAPCLSASRIFFPLGFPSPHPRACSCPDMAKETGHIRPEPLAFFSTETAIQQVSLWSLASRRRAV